MIRAYSSIQAVQAMGTTSACQDTSFVQKRLKLVAFGSDPLCPATSYVLGLSVPRQPMDFQTMVVECFDHFI